MNIIRHILLFSTVALLMACEEKSDLELMTENTKLIVVEGIVTNENISHRVKLSRTFTSQNEEPIPVSADTVVITDGTTFYSLTESPVGSGNFYTPPFRAVFGKPYFLIFWYQGKRYTAGDSPPPGQPLDPILYIEVDNNDTVMHRLDLKDSGTESNFIEYDVNWESTIACAATTDCFSKLIYYDLKTIDVHEIYKPDKQDFLFPKSTRIIRKKYSLSKPYETYLRSLLSETEWRGGIFDLERANVTTNLSEGAIGFFAASTVEIDTTIVE